MIPRVPHPALAGGRQILAFVGFLAAVALPAGGAEETQEPSLTALESRAVEILRTLRDPDAPGPAISGPRIGELGSEVVDCLLDVLVSRRVPAIGEGEQQVLSEPQNEAVLLALEEVGREAVLARIETRFAEPTGFAERAAAIAGVGAVGTAAEVGLLAECAASADEDELDPRIQAVFRAAATRVLMRDPKALPRLESTWSGLPEALLPQLVLAVGASGDSRGLELLTEICTWVPDLAHLVTTQVSALGPSDSRDVNRSLAERLRLRLSEEDVEAGKAACLALGVLEDFRCVPELIDLLDGESAGVRRNAHWALCRLTGKNTAPSAPLWRHWYEQESRWFRDSEQAVLNRLTSPSQAQVLGALREVARHRLHRHRLAVAVAPLLYAAEEPIRIAAVSVLADLRSRWAAGDLIEVLDDPVDAVRLAAAAALERITGERRGPAREAWEGYVAPEPLLSGF